jgi:hypothetical protein
MQCTWLFFVGHKYLIYQHKLSTTRELQLVTENVFKAIVAHVK